MGGIGRTGLGILGPDILACISWALPLLMLSYLLSSSVETYSLFNTISKKSKSLNNLDPERKGSWLQVKMDGRAQRHGSLPRQPLESYFQK